MPSGATRKIVADDACFVGRLGDVFEDVPRQNESIYSKSVMWYQCFQPALGFREYGLCLQSSPASPYDGFPFLGTVGFGDDSTEKPLTPATPRNFNVTLGRRNLVADALRSSRDDLGNIGASADTDVAVLPHTERVSSAWAVLAVKILQGHLQLLTSLVAPRCTVQSTTSAWNPDGAEGNIIFGMPTLGAAILLYTSAVQGLFPCTNDALCLGWRSERRRSCRR